MKIKCLIVDDEPIARAIVRDYCTQLGFFEIVDECENVFDAIPHLQKNEIQLVFLDINMPQMNGLDFLKTLINPPKVILTTAYSEFALEGYDLNITDYLLKPFSLARFTRAIQRTSIPVSNESFGETSVTKLVIKYEGKVFFIEFEDILYCEAQANYTQIITQRATHLPYLPLYKVEEQLPKTSFCRIHRSFIVNKNKIKGLDGNHILLEEYRIPIGQQFKESLLQELGL